MQALLLYPHQLFASNIDLGKSLDRVYLIEEPLFFSQYAFHKQKLVLHRASMQAHAQALRAGGLHVKYLEFHDGAVTPDLFARLAADQVSRVHYLDVVDDWLERRLRRASMVSRIDLERHATPMFMTGSGLLKRHFGGTAHPRMATFYADQRREHDILMKEDSPVGGRWSFDTENRKKLPRKMHVPTAPRAPGNPFVQEAQRYVEARFPNNPGSVEPFLYPVTPEDAHHWLGDFLRHRLCAFGAYEDAIAQHHDVLFHSQLTPALNIGLLTPREVIDAALARRETPPINSLEGFVRQVIGWREYMRGAYLANGGRQRTRNFWNHARTIPRSFWSASTGIEPIDAVIRKLRRCAYAHHIERLMVLSNFMLLCEFDPDQVYRWFMEMFIDSYDWVMVPNVYGMALYADGGGITTKPYISGSNYLLKMSDFDRGPWCDVWDGLYWRFVARHREIFAANRRTQVLVMGLERMPAAKLSQHLEAAEAFLQRMDAEARGSAPAS